ncbi:large conductance mechanosensitive channel protein MscL [Candidatus Liberibacter sp.]|uniref:large conductance mechanosensitive channel protein MscL n=1 Tax=Candidatus Liberibacter sp. TaxID=34022 RepID=UPI0015F358F5|nr:large conductance mechanosensitive channel protein MscL [Candidatus Liberibacter sp.]MBA5724411.1 large conductance mechanosensitive channel protein MscL [Candidatus Liberibacter sp.]
MVSEFKNFIARGNVIDLAIGVIIGGALNRVVESLVKDIVMPLVGFCMGSGADFSNHFIPLSTKVVATVLSEARKQGAVFAYGSFITIIVNFFILAFIVFCLMQFVNKLVHKQLSSSLNKKETSPSADIMLLTEIRDLLKKR